MAASSGAAACRRGGGIKRRQRQCPRRARGHTPLHSAALTNQPVVINTLLAAGANVKSDAKDAKTPLDLVIPSPTRVRKGVIKGLIWAQDLPLRAIEAGPSVRRAAVRPGPNDETQRDDSRKLGPEENEEIGAHAERRGARQRIAQRG